MRIFEYAKIADWEARLTTLSGIAEPENWNYVAIPSKSQVPILDSYIRYTFDRAYDQQKVVEAENCACFNTGLITVNQQEIYGLFTVSETFDASRPLGPDNQKWWLKNWVKSGDFALGAFRELPDLVDYWSDPSVIVFDPKLEIDHNLEHILRDNLNRFPMELGGKVDEKGRPTDLNGEAGEEHEPNAENVPEAAIPLATRNAFDGAIRHSIKLAKRSYRIAIPQFYRNKIQLLLPIYLRTPNKPDLALTLEKSGGWYRAATVLYPDWAYRHARLLSRPNSEWLGGFRGDALPRRN